MIGKVKANMVVNILHQLFPIFRLFQIFKQKEVQLTKLKEVMSGLLSLEIKFMIFGLSQKEILIQLTKKF